MLKCTVSVLPQSQNLGEAAVLGHGGHFEPLIIAMGKPKGNDDPSLEEAPKTQATTPKPADVKP
jgi:hypothetical protein